MTRAVQTVPLVRKRQLRLPFLFLSRIGGLLLRPLFTIRTSLCNPGWARPV